MTFDPDKFLSEEDNFDPDQFIMEGEEKSSAEISELESAKAGFVQGATLNSIDEIEGTIATAKDLVNDPVNTFSNFSAVLNKNLDDRRTYYKNAQDINEKSFLAGEVTGGVATAAVTGGTSLGAKLFANGLKAAMAAGSAAGFFKSEDKFSLEGATETAIGGLAGVAGGAVGTGAGKLVGKGIKKLKADKLQSIERQKAGQLFDAIGVDGKADFKNLDNSLRFRNISKEQYAQDMFEDLDIINKEVTSADEVLQLMTDKKSEIWKKNVNPILNQIDNELPEGSINPKEIIDTMTDEFRKGFFEKSDDELIRSSERISKKLKDLADEGKLLTINEAQNLKVDIGRTISATSESDRNLMRTIANRVIRDSEDRVIEKVFGENSDELTQIMNARRKYGNLVETEDFMKGTVADEAARIRKFDRSILEFQDKTKIFSRLTTPRDIGGDLAEGIASPGKVVKGFANFVRRNPGNFLPPERIKSLQKIADSIDAQPGKYSSYVNKIMSASGRSTEAFIESIGLLESVTELHKVPTKRTSQGLLEDAPHILNIAKDQDPEMYKKIKSAYEENDMDLLKTIMSDVGRTSFGKQFMEPGIGVDGKAVTEMDFIDAQQIIKNAPIKPKQRMKHMENLQINNTLPVFEEDQPTMIQTAIKERNNGIKKTDF